MGDHGESKIKDKRQAFKQLFENLLVLGLVLLFPMVPHGPPC